MKYKIRGRLYMTIAVCTTFCICCAGLLLSSDVEIETKMAVFVALSTLTSSIAKDYFTRSDRKNDTDDENKTILLNE